MDKSIPPTKRTSPTVWLAISFSAVALLLAAYALSTSVEPSPRRLQEPKQPFPYRAEEVSFTNRKAGITLAGTLTMPERKNEKYPAVILISGYGAQNRDAEWNGHKPFLVIADYLTNQGMAVLRYDDRGYGQSTGSYDDGTSLDFSTDVESAIEFLKTRSEIDSTNIGLIGHSDGGMIAPMVAARSSDVKFIIMLGSPGILGGELMIKRQMLWARKSGKSDQEIERSKQYMERLIGIIVHSESNKDLTTALEKFGNDTKDQIPSDQIPDGVTRDEFIARQVRMLSSPWFKFFFTYNPQDDLKNVKCPVLALTGEKDVQAPAAHNLAAIEQALVSGGNRNVIVKELKGLNHMFQESTTGMIDEYVKIEQTFSPVALEEISTFIKSVSEAR